MKNTTCKCLFNSFFGVDEFFSSADFMDDDYIKELLLWIHPHIANKDPIQYTEEENLQLLSLPRKECPLLVLLVEK